MLSLKKSNKRVSSRRNIDIEGVQEGILMLPNGRYRAILRVSSINFDLKSPEEQEAIIATYQSFLNSLKFPIQVVTRTRALDMDKYIADFEAKLEGEENPIYRRQIENYTKYVSALIENNKILSRQFYVVVPYNAAKGERFELAKEQVNSRCNHVTNNLARLGMTVKALTSVEILELFYSFYSPRLAKLQPVTNNTIDAIKNSYV